MDGVMRKRSLMQKSLLRFIVCVAMLLLLAMPLFYLLTKNFYAEDMLEVLESVRQGRPMPSIDLEEDVVHGIVLQFILIFVVLGVALVLMLGLLSKRMWRPFDRTLEAIEHFDLESGTVPALPDCGVREFSRLNAALERLMRDNLNSYRLQKEFTENASHELQTPLAVFQSKLDMLLQQPNLTEGQASIIQDLYRMSSRLSRLNRNLLLLAKMENGQFAKQEMNVVDVLEELQPYFENLAGSLHLSKEVRVPKLIVSANRSLLESMVSNLVVNAVRHNVADGQICLTLDGNSLAVANTSDGEALDGSRIFHRFYRPSETHSGNGLGLAIVKAICDYHGWSVSYGYNEGWHVFTVVMG